MMFTLSNVYSLKVLLWLEITKFTLVTYVSDVTHVAVLGRKIYCVTDQTALRIGLFLILYTASREGHSKK